MFDPFLLREPQPHRHLRRCARSLLATAGAFVVLGAVSCSDDDDSTTTTAGTAAIDPAARADELQAAVDEVMTKYDVPGIVAGVWTKSGSWTSATGEGGDGPLSLNDHFAIRSVTKSFVVTVLLQLADEGKASLDDSIDEYVPGVPEGQSITLSNVAGMSSGLADYTKVDGFVELFVEDFTREFTTDELLDFAFAEPLEFEPGTAYSYSNTNTLLVGKVIESITGRPLVEELDERILDPLELDDTAYHVEGSEVPSPASLGFVVAPDEEPQPVAVAFSAFGPSGAMTSNLEDLNRWATALGSGELLSSTLQSARLDAARPATNGPRYDEYGLGIGHLDGWWGHTGSGLGYQAAAFYDPTSESTIAVILNTAPEENAQAELFQALREVLE